MSNGAVPKCKPYFFMQDTSRQEVYESKNSPRMGFFCGILHRKKAPASLHGLVFLFLSWVTSSYALTIDTEDQAALQRGARTYMNYCSGCHSLRYMRYSRMAEDLGLTTFDGQVDKPLLMNNLIFTKAAIEDPIQISMPMVEARQWFGVEPPDLSLVARARGAEWLYAFLKGFYADPHRPFGSNNIVFPDVAMPDAFAPLRGDVEYKQGELILVKQGKMSPQELDQVIQDVVTFLVYVGEPIRDVRRQVGVFVLGLLMVLLGFVYGLKRLYWKAIL